jgi:endonuclease/exonuclease/phosphatase (EEP) superfamily protein YafD
MLVLLSRLDVRLHLAAALSSAFALGLAALASRFVVYGVPGNVFRPIWGLAALLTAGIVAAFWMTPRRRHWRLLASAAAYMLVTLAVTAEFGSRLWLAELLTHFRPQLAGGLLVVAVIASFARQWTAAVLATVFFVWHVPMIAPYLFAAPQPTTTASKPLKVLVANLMYGNEGFARFRAIVAGEQPDLIAAVEVTYDWQRELAALDESYKYRKIVSAPNDSPLGVGVWSKRPIKDVSVRRPDPDNPPWLLVEMDSTKTPLAVVVVHPPNPVHPSSMALRDRQLKDIAMTLRERPGETIAVGDFNAAPWSPIFKDFCNRSRLRDARLGFGAHPSWPAGAPGLRIPIDHCLVSGGIAVRGFKRAAGFGSDHLPIVADLEVPE